VTTPVERIHALGYWGASVHDLLAVALARRPEDVSVEVAHHIFGDRGKLRNLLDLSVQELRDGAGLEPFEAMRFLSTVEIGRRIANSSKGDESKGETAQAVADALGHLRFEKQEHFCAVLFDAQLKIIRVATIHVGTQTGAMVSPADVFRPAIRDGAVCIAVGHNHPSGEVQPSAEDIAVTDRLVSAGKLLEIDVLDHLIIGERGYFSFRERGLMT
jgi:DNA repair protein RadC